jgi:hypothetical protein
VLVDTSAREALMTIPYAEVIGVYGGERVLYEISGGRLNSSRTG